MIYSVLVRDPKLVYSFICLCVCVCVCVCVCPVSYAFLLLSDMQPISADVLVSTRKG